MSAVAARFLTVSARSLIDEHLPKIREAVNLLSEAEFWRREGEVSNSIGNLLLHLTGNVRQYIVSGVGGAADQRHRPGEFAARDGLAKAELLALLEATVSEAAAVLERVDPERLLEERVIQNRPQTLLDAIYHCVEHFGYHTGQIVYIVKAQKQHPFDWYRHLNVP